MKLYGNWRLMEKIISTNVDLSKIGVKNSGRLFSRLTKKSSSEK